MPVAGGGGGGGGGGEGRGGRESLSSSNTRYKQLSKRCPRCCASNEEPEAPTLQESFVIVLHKMNKITKSPSDACFLLFLELPYFVLIGITLLLVQLSGNYKYAVAIVFCGLVFFFIRFWYVKYLGHRYTERYAESGVSYTN
ncbi:hypothetical protein SK128_015222 [Halocaridina rubra]|uniref:Uncharacterized protein n=1 Tax=Halocaridina rubra TaxID=373956 RepID=A0AAN9A4Y9_HALRR